MGSGAADKHSMLSLAHPHQTQAPIGLSALRQPAVGSLLQMLLKEGALGEDGQIAQTGMC
jgi:hypothetical protein